MKESETKPYFFISLLPRTIVTENSIDVHLTSACNLFGQQSLFWKRRNYTIKRLDGRT
jgi:hypothetical protein